MVFAIALLGIARFQNPFPADLTVPEDWRYYGKSSRYERSGIYSPQGLEIGYPDYTPTGMVAQVHYEMFGRTFFFAIVIERTLVHAAVAPDGAVSISYPDDRSAGYKAPGHTFDYWSHPNGLRQAAQAILVPLTRLDHHRTPKDDLSALKNKRLPTVKSPFSLLQVTHRGGFVERTPTSLRIASAQVTLDDGRPAKTKWSESTPLLSGRLEIAEDVVGKIWFTWAPIGKQQVVLATSSREASSIVLGALAALTYSTGG